MSEQQILLIIRRIRESFPDALKVYTQGSCVKFAMILLEVVGDGEILYNMDHAIFEYKGTCYDITGITKKTNHIPILEYGIFQVAEILKLTYK